MRSITQFSADSEDCHTMWYAPGSFQNLLFQSVREKLKLKIRVDDNVF